MVTPAKSLDLEVFAAPLLHKYRSYRDFMRDSYNYRKSLRSGFSYRRFSELSGVKSPNFLQQVIRGEKNMSEEVASGVAKALRLTTDEKIYFVALVRLENAKNSEQKEDAYRGLLKASKTLITKEIPSAQKQILNQWYYLVIREMAFAQDFRADGQWISEKLRGAISPEEASDALTILFKGGFLRPGANSACIPEDPVLDTGAVFDTVRVLRNHQQTLHLWSHLIDKINPEDREMGLLNIPISREKIPEFKKRILQFQDEIIGWIQDEKDPDQIVQLGTYLIPVTKILKTP